MYKVQILLQVTYELSFFCAFCHQVIQHKTVKYQLLPLSPLSIQRLSKYKTYFNNICHVYDHTGLLTFTGLLTSLNDQFVTN